MPLDHATLAQLAPLLRQDGKVAEQAARRLYDMLWGSLVRYFKGQRQDDAMAEDLASETLAKVVLRIHSLRDDLAFLGWIWSIARNELLGEHRDRAAAVEAETALDEESWQALFETHADPTQSDPVQRLCLQGQLERFRHDHPERAYCLEQVVLEDWDGHALAAFLERSYGAAREYLSQCRKKLADYLRHCFDAHHNDPFA